MILRLFVVAPLVAAGCAGTAEPEPVAAGELIALHVDEGSDVDVATCAISILIDDVHPEALYPDADRSPVDALIVEETFNACGAANGLLAEPEEQPVELAFSIEPQIYGDDRALDLLWDGCEAGDGEACDALWAEAPVGSVYEQFGVTCGDRLELLNCAEELVAEPIDSEPESDAEADADDDFDSESAVGTDVDSDPETDVEAEAESDTRLSDLAR